MKSLIRNIALLPIRILLSFALFFLSIVIIMAGIAEESVGDAWDLIVCAYSTLWSENF